MNAVFDLKLADSLARKYFSQGYHCSEAAVRAITEVLDGSVDPQLMNVSTPFCGGMSGTGRNACGVLSGALIVIGSKFGRSLPDQDDTTCMELAKEYYEEFEKMANCSSVNCNTLREHRPNGSCNDYVANGVTLAIQLIEKYSKEDRPI